MKYHALGAVRKNGREGKPLEDFCICDIENNIYIVTDGVTQDAADYQNITDKSDAGMAAEIAAKAVHETLIASGNSVSSLERGVRLAIERVAGYSKTAAAAYPPATCLVACCMQDGVLHYAYIGDSVVLLLRGTAKIQLAEQQTNAIATYQRLSGERIPKRYTYDHITNNIHSPLAYGVILGDIRAMDLLCTASIRLEPGDRVIVSSDGLDSYLLYTPLSEIKTLPPEDMILRSARYDEPPYGSYADDKSIITIDAEA